MSLEISIVLASIVSKAKNTNLLTVIKQLRNPFMIVECVESGCLFTNFLLRYKSTQRQQKQTKQASSLLKKGALVSRQTIVRNSPSSINQIWKERIVCGQKVEETIGDVYCPIVQHAEMKSVLTFQPTKHPVFMTVEKKQSLLSRADYTF